MKKPNKQDQNLNPALTKQKVPVALSRGDRRKIEIVNSTIFLLSDKGLQELTFEAIGKKCGISKSHVLYHFRTLDDLVYTCVTYAYAIGQKTVSEYIQREKKQNNLLRAYVFGTFHWIETHPEHSSVASLLAYLSTWNVRYRKLQTEIKHIGMERIIAILQRMKQEKETHRVVLADTIQSLLVGKLLYLSATEKKQSIKDLRIETWKVIERLL